MNGNKFLVDTNAIIYHLNGNQQVEALLEGAEIFISSITYTELLSGKLSDTENEILNAYLAELNVLHTNEAICRRAAQIRKTVKIKLPDALIAATAAVLELPIVTFDADFERVQDIALLKLNNGA